MLTELQQKWSNCNLCPFAPWRNNMVWAKGRIDAGIVLVGEAPGKDEDVSGVPFVGKAGRILDEALQVAGLRYDANPNCLVVNALACRPCNQRNGPNRSPHPEEIEWCRSRLWRLLRIAKPSMLVLLGNSAATSVYGYSAVPAEMTLKGIHIFKTLHPMATVYDPTRLLAWDAFWKGLKEQVKAHNRKRVFPWPKTLFDDF